jgi:hypothetical protein
MACHPGQTFPALCTGFWLLHIPQMGDMQCNFIRDSDTLAYVPFELPLGSVKYAGKKTGEKYAWSVVVISQRRANHKPQHQGNTKPGHQKSDHFVDPQ